MVESQDSLASVVDGLVESVRIGVVSAGLVRVLLVRISIPSRVVRVPVVGRVMDVLAVTVSAVLYMPEVVKSPPSVIVFPELFTPVPPYCPAIAVPFQVPVVMVPTEERPDRVVTASLTRVPVSGNVTFDPKDVLRVIL